MGMKKVIYITSILLAGGVSVLIVKLMVAYINYANSSDFIIVVGG